MRNISSRILIIVDSVDDIDEEGGQGTADGRLI